jgi:hypothetical protein
LKTWNEVRPSETPEELLNELIPFVERLKENGNVVSITIVTVVPLCHGGLCFLKKHLYTFHVVTHKAQNH